jgi:electron transport complex protein RnfG
VLVLGGGGAVAGLLLVVAYLATLEPIRAHRAQALAEGVRSVLGLSERDPYDSLWLVDGALTTNDPGGGRPADLWRATRAGGAPGWAIAASGNGFVDAIRLLVGYDAKEKRVLAVEVLENKETPGLGDRIAKDPTFCARFAGKRVPVRGVPPDATPNGDDEVDTITGATISSRSVVRILDQAVAAWSGAIDAYEAGAAAGGAR